MSKVIETTVYLFSELSEKAKQTALQSYRETYPEFDWYESAFEDFKEIAALMGVNVSTINFTGFSCQGDGACFAGDFEYARGMINAVKEYAPKDTALHRIAADIQAACRAAFYSYTASVTCNGLYSHSGTMRVEIAHVRDSALHNQRFEREITAALRALADWLYAALEREYVYLTSDETLTENITANDWYFTAAGKMV